MTSAFLSLAFRASGLSPTDSALDKIPFAVLFSWQVVAGAESVLFWRSRGQTSFHQVILSVSVVILYFGFILFALYANVCVKNFTSLTRRAAPPKHTSRFLTSAVGVYFLALFTNCTFISLNGAGVASSITRCINLYNFGVPALQFCVAADLLHGRFLRLNDRLRGLHGSAPPPHRPAAPTVALFKEHVELRKLVHDVSAYFALYQMLCVIGRIIFITTNLYTILISFSHNTDVKVHAEYFAAVFYQSLVIVLQCVSANRCLKEANDTVNIAHAHTDPTYPLELMAEVSDFSLYMFDNPVVFSVGGIFSMSNALITKAVGSTITYLIIAIQLGSLQDST